MKGVFGFLGLAAAAIALALLVGSNDANLTLFWQPYRIDLSFNLALFGLLLLFLLLHAALRALALLRSLPQQAQRWRVLQLERTALTSVLDALAQHYAGRYVRAQSAARLALAQLEQLGDHHFPGREQAQLLAQLLQAESAHELGNTEERDRALAAALAGPTVSWGSEARAGLSLRAAAWALEQQDATTAAHWLADLPQGVARRIHALRLRLRLARLQQDHPAAIELVRLLAKHRAYSAQASASLLRGLVQDTLRAARDQAALLQAWRALGPAERAMPELALAALEQWDRVSADGDAVDALPGARRWLEESLQLGWGRYASLDADLQRRWLLRLEAELPRLGSDWLAQIEQAQQRRASSGSVSCALAWASRVAALPQSWRSLARLAEQRGDADAAQAAWKKAALL